MSCLISSMTTGVDNLPVVLEYARQWRVLPLAWITDEGLCGCSWSSLQSPGEAPFTNNGVKDATTDRRPSRAGGRSGPRPTSESAPAGNLVC